jgi:hypothetical protein
VQGWNVLKINSPEDSRHGAADSKDLAPGKEKPPGCPWRNERERRIQID